MIAGAVLVVIYFAGKWQERRLLRRLGEQFGGEVGDALLASDPPPTARTPAARARIEPRLEIPTGDDFHPGGELDQAADLAPPDAAEAEPVASNPKRSDWVEDPMLDCVLELRCTRQVDGVSFIDAAMPLTSGQWPLPVSFVVWDARAEQWVHPDRFGHYTDALAAIQLADRRRVLDQEQVGRFVAAVRHAAVLLDADCDPPDLARVAAGAAELDRLCARFDVRIALNLEAMGGPWTQARVASVASQASLVPAGSLKWAPPSSGGVSPLSLSMPAAVAERASLELDVPRTPTGAGIVQALFSLGNQLAAQLNARLVDDNRRPIDADSVTAIEAQLEKLFAEMKAAGIDAGGERARRLYT